eukprot:CAMPEP_0182433248 /NCGR_PEP_ID=MMETSP1167-20130531/61971_1 /TAXON_ID=2988 /ORGANISM="Mallomonas Sp, Strain CCMP3275" /LENGTH=33 /DNA_ID= /DNA_START= /DNA_END= /DNA_ORIENTATION=
MTLSEVTQLQDALKLAAEEREKDIEREREKKER